MTTAISAPQATGNPYVGPQSFRRGDSFYGRDHETSELLDLLIARRIVLLHSPSGAGKSSLIAAGLAPQLESEGFEVLPTIRVTHEPPPGSTLVGPPRNRYVLGTLLSLDEGLPKEHQRHTNELDSMTIREYLGGWPDLDGRPGNEVLVFDQFEEIITAVPNDDAVKEVFFAEVGAALRDRNLWALFSMREDFLGELDPYARLVPTRFNNRYRLDLLSAEQAREAIILPAADREVNFREAAAERLVDDLRRVRIQRAGGVQEELGPSIEPVQLQVACRQVWNRLNEHERVIDVDDVEGVGNVDQALANYYAESVATAAHTGVSERALRDWFEFELVTPQGIRGQVLSGPRYDGGSSEQAVKLLTDAHLVRAESRRGATWYELAHDRLIKPVMDDNARWREEHESYYEKLAAFWDDQGRPDAALLLGYGLVEAEKWAVANQDTLSQREREFFEASRKAAQAERERRANKRTRRWLVVAMIGCVLALVAVIFASNERERAAALAADAEANVVAGQAAATAGFDAELSLVLGQEAAAISREAGRGLTDFTKDALNQAVSQSPVLTALHGHGPAARAVYSADGSIIVTGHDNGDVVVWDANGEKPAVVATAADMVDAVDISPDGQWLAYGALDGTLAVGPTDGKGDPSVLTSHDGAVYNVAFSPDGSMVASARADGTVLVAKVNDTSVLQRFRRDDTSAEMNDVEWIDDERLVAVDDDGVVSWWTLGAVEPIREMRKHDDLAVETDVNGRLGLVASAGFDRTVVVMDIETGAEVYQLPGFSYRFTDVSFSSDGTRLVAVDEDGNALVTDAATGAELRSVTANEAWIGSVDVDPANPNRAIVVSDSHDPALWDVSPGHTRYETAVVSRPDGTVVTAAYEGSVIKWAPDLTHDVLVPASDDPIEDASLSRRGDLIALARTSGAVEVWSLEKSAQVFAGSVRDYTDNTDDGWSVAISRDGRSVAAGTANGNVVVWELFTGDGRLLAAHTAGVRSLDFGANDRQLVSAAETTAIIWDIEREAPQHMISIDDDPSTAWSAVVAWNDQGTVVAVGEEDGSVLFLDPESLPTDDVPLTPPTTTAGHDATVNDLAFDASGDRLASGGADRSIMIWDANAGEFLHRIRHGEEAWRVAFSADGERLVVGDGSGVPRVVYLNDDELLQVARQKTTRDLGAGECEGYLGAGADCPTD